MHQYEWAIPVVLVVVEGRLAWLMRRLVRQATDSIQEERNTIRGLQPPLQAATLDSLEKALDHRQTGLGKAWRTLKAIGTLPTVDIGLALRSATVEYERIAAALRVYPNHAMLWGLLATVVSLAWGFSGLGGDILTASQSTTPGKLVEGIAPYIDRFRSAFLSTAIGLIAALVFAWQARERSGLIEEHVGAVEAFLIETCAPAVIPPSLEHSLSLIHEALKTANRVAIKTSKDMNAAAKAIGDQVQLMEQTTQVAIESYRAISGDIKEGADRLQRNVEALAQVQRSVQEGYGRIQDQMAETFDKLMAQHRVAVESLHNISKALTDRLTANVAELLTQLDSTTSRIEAAGNKFDEAATAFRHMSHEVGQRAYDAMAEWSSKFHDQLTTHQQMARLIDVQLRETAAAIRDLMERLNPQLLHSDDWESVKRVLHDGAATGKLFVEQVDRLHQNLAAQNEQFAAIGMLLSRIDAAGDKFDEAATAFREMGQEVGQRAYDAMAEWSSKFHDQLTTHQQMARLIDVQLRETAAAIRDLMERLNPQLLHSDDWKSVKRLLHDGAATGKLFVEQTELLQQHLAAQNEHLATIGSTLPTVGQAMVATSRSMKEAAGRFTRELEAQSEAVRTLVANALKAATALEAAVSSAAGLLEEAGKQRAEQPPDKKRQTRRKRDGGRSGDTQDLASQAAASEPSADVSRAVLSGSDKKLPAHHSDAASEPPSQGDEQ